MSVLVQARPVNEPFSDPGVYVDFRYGRRALLFDMGDLSPLSAREILRVSHVFVSHMHVDHFVGFDRLLRLCLYREMQVAFFGPPGLVDSVEAKLRAYSWNLLGEESCDFSIRASDWTPQGIARSALFRARTAFRREDVAPGAHRGAVLLADPDFRIEALALDHGIPSLAFALQETVRVNVHKARLDALGLPVGPWLTAAKRALRGGGGPQSYEPQPGRIVSLEALVASGALHAAPGQRIVYATDLAYSPANVDALTGFAGDADLLFIEAGFLEEDRILAAERKHLTAAQAGHIARMARVRRAIPMHFSPRYVQREAELRAEFQRCSGMANIQAEAGDQA